MVFTTFVQTTSRELPGDELTPRLNALGLRPNSVSPDLVSLSRRGAFPDTRSKPVSGLDVRNPVTTEAVDLGPSIYEDARIPVLPPDTVAGEPHSKDSSPSRHPVHRSGELDRRPALPAGPLVQAIRSTLEDRVMQWVIGKRRKVPRTEVVDGRFAFTDTDCYGAVDTAKVEDGDLPHLMPVTRGSLIFKARVLPFAEFLGEGDRMFGRSGD
jgi:hypothetical protein